ncbi:hypothetical protein BLNAU_23171 [Blattamonas nauphoetae]|uniref:SWIRM domain-containing protein n=1 Tax=Blattamonas nauphoetae TaxID=2049346 RepID=A0ABQ9WT61_9EUKA|nr:hypothetical protein BLNAU_23171 [Blattamonas nauphoetae]
MASEKVEQPVIARHSSSNVSWFQPEDISEYEISRLSHLFCMLPLPPDQHHAWYLQIRNFIISIARLLSPEPLKLITVTKLIGADFQSLHKIWMFLREENLLPNHDSDPNQSNIFLPPATISLLSTQTLNNSSNSTVNFTLLTDNSQLISQVETVFEQTVSNDDPSPAILLLSALSSSTHIPVIHLYAAFLQYSLESVFFTNNDNQQITASPSQKYERVLHYLPSILQPLAGLIQLPLKLLYKLVHTTISMYYTPFSHELFPRYSLTVSELVVLSHTLSTIRSQTNTLKIEQIAASQRLLINSLQKDLLLSSQREKTKQET